LLITQEQSFAWLEQRVLNRLAMSHYCLGKLDTAYAFSRQVQAKRHHDDKPQNFFEFTSAQILAGLGRWRDAERVYQQVLTRKRTSNHMAVTTLLPELAALARLALRQGEQSQALIYVEEMLAILQTHPHIATPDLYFDAYAIDLICYEILHAHHDP